MTFRQASLIFPPADIGVVGPRHDREGFLLGLTMFTASRRRIVWAQRAAFATARLFGPNVLPARRTELVMEEWEELLDATGGLLDRISSVATYVRRDPRAGRTMLARREDGWCVLLKTRRSSAGLEREQAMLESLQSGALRDISVPRPLGLGVAGGLTWSAQEFVFRRPHRPVFHLSDGQLAALDRAIADAAARLGLPGDDPALAPAHRDLTPWNLRQDHEGRTWLLDWEDVGLAPRGADRAYLDLTAAAVRGSTPASMPASVARYWTGVLEARIADGHVQRINSVLLERLRELPGR